MADDRFGHEIVDYLRDEGVDTSFLKLIDDAHTPFTGVAEFELGDSIAFNWPNHMEVHLDIRDVDRVSQHFAACDVILMTFEIPRETLQHTLNLVNGLDKPSPVIIATPGHPILIVGFPAKLSPRSTTLWRTRGSSATMRLQIGNRLTLMSPLGSY